MTYFLKYDACSIRPFKKYSTSNDQRVPIRKKQKYGKSNRTILIKGTIDDINFVVTASGNYARTKGKTGVTAEEFKIILFDRIRNQGKDLDSA
jgi:hypothetical protein